MAKLSYEEYLKTQIKYDGKTECFVGTCHKPGLYEGGDARWWCGMCEEHANMKSRYNRYLEDFRVNRTPENKELPAVAELKRLRGEK